MAGTVHRRSLSWAAAFALPVTMLLGVAGGAHSPTARISVHNSSSADAPDCASVSPARVTNGTTPILFVHGIDSDPTMWTDAKKGQVDGTGKPPLTYVQTALDINKVTGYTFDWSSASGVAPGSKVMWVTDPPSSNLGAQLAQAISCVADKAGHKVIIIAHSIGGLITKDASSIAQKDIAAVFTLGTPYQGSWLASTAVGQGPDPALNLLGQAISVYCSIYSPSAHEQPLTRHHKPPAGAIQALCHYVNQRSDPGVEAMRLNGGPNDWPNGGWKKLHWPSSRDFPVYALASSIQGTWQPLWPLNFPEPLTGSGDVVVGTNSQVADGSLADGSAPTLADGSPPTVSCPVKLRTDLSTPMAEGLSLLDALAALSCFHPSEPYNKTLLDDIISIIQAKHMLPTAEVGSAPSTLACSPAAIDTALAAKDPQGSSSRTLVAFACKDGWAVAEVHQPLVLSDGSTVTDTGYAVLTQGTTGWISEGLEDGTCLQPGVCRRKNLPPPALLQTLLHHAGINISGSADQVPDFYYSSAVLPQELYVKPAYPDRLGIDNHDFIAVQRVDAWGADSMTMTGVLYYDKCTNGCAAGPVVTYPVQVVASVPQTCKVQIGSPGSTTYEEAYVFSKINVRALSGGLPTRMAGESVFRVCGP